MSRELVIDGTIINDSSDCYVIAEVGQNHCGSLDLCKKLFDAAKWAGCNAVKLQKRDNKTLYTEEFYNSPYNSENAFGATYGEHREALEFDFRQYELLKAYAESIGLTFFATAFDIPSADFLAKLNVPAIKIASGDLTNVDLRWAALDTEKPLIVSTGGAGDYDLVFPWTYTYAKLAILHCTSGYPAKYEELNLLCIGTLRDRFPESVIGWSAHDTGIAMAPVAYALGARIIEKHFTLDRSMKGTDQAMSLEPGAMKKMIENLKLCRLALGDGIKRQYPSEIESLKKQRKNADGRIDGRTVS
jgi:sialic acid synthase